MNDQSHNDIFVIDPDEAIRDSISTLLNSFGANVYDFRDAASFLSAFQCSMTGCVLVENQLPDRNGLELLTQIRSMGCKIPVLIITSITEKAFLREAKILGATEVLIKPLDSRTLLSHIQLALSTEDC